MAEYYDLLTDHTQRTPLTPAPEITEVEHVTVRHDPGWYCAHPRWGVYKDFGGGEVIVGFKMARSAYKQISDINHGGVVRPGYEARAVIVVQRSLDGGRTWPREHDVILYDEAVSDDEKRAFLYQEGAPREQYDMFSPDSVFWFTHTNLWDEQRMVCFGLRSADRGRTWEKVPTVIDPPPGRAGVRKKFSPVVRRPDGRTLITVFNDGTSPIYRSLDQGVTWEFVSRSAVDPTGAGSFTYDGLIQLPSGELQCYQTYFGQSLYDRDPNRNSLTMSSSVDGGYTWTTPVPTVGEGGSCWNFPAAQQGREDVPYRSGYPVLLDDGRIVVVWARRLMPFGVGGTLSADGGRTWSEEFIIRADDTGSWDHGYAIGGQAEDGRVYITYYYNEPDKPYVESIRYIDSTFFRV